VIDFLDRGCRCRDGALFNAVTGRRVQAILPVHILGHPVNMSPIIDVARKYGLAVIEDATESLGAEYERTSVGNLGDIACFSFNGNKLITTGGGGMIVTNNGEWAAKAKYLTTQAKDDPVEYIHHEIGYNYRLTNIQAAMGVGQMEQLDACLLAKRKVAFAYGEALHDLPGITTMREASWARSAFWMYTILICGEEFGMDSRTLLKELARHNIQTRPLWQPLHMSKAHAGAYTTGCPVAERLNQEALSLPCSVGLTHDQQMYVIDIMSAIPAAPRA
jgi:perosamine synthetase